MREQEILTKARALLVERGWTQQAYVGFRGELDLMGAIYVAAGVPESPYMASSFDTYLDAEINDEIRSIREWLGFKGTTPAIWNDESGRTIDEVLARIDAALEEIPDPEYPAFSNPSTEIHAIVSWS